MNSYVKNTVFEKEFTDKLLAKMRPFLAESGLSLVRVGFPKGFDPYNIVLESQKTFGDFMVVRDHDSFIVATSDLKLERKSSRNIFFETHSNAMMAPPGTPNGYKSGWGVTLKSQFIWWVFSDSGVMASINLVKLRKWLNEPVKKSRASSSVPRYLTFPECVQQGHAQANVTVGRLIPFRLLDETIWKQSFATNGEEFRSIDRNEFLSAIGENVSFQGGKIKKTPLMNTGSAVV